jgi:hypothetical protein
MKTLLLSLVLALIATFALGQAQTTGPAPKLQAAAIGPDLVQPTITETVSYLLPVEIQKQFRDSQLEWDELEIDTQKMLVKIEQNKARQMVLADAQRKAAFQFAMDKKIDLNANDLDAKELKFIPKKKAIK